MSKAALRPGAINYYFRVGVAAVLSIVSGCVAVPVYDSKTDDLLTGLQRDTDSFIQNLSNTYDTTTGAGKACEYSSNARNYDALKLSRGLLRTRANALYDNQATLAALEKLDSTYDALENAHRTAAARPDHCILPELLVTDQQATDSAIGGLLKLELAKKGNP